MTTKKVAVRLVAENGRQVRAELEGVGNAGEKAFGRIDARAQAMSRVVTVALAAAAAAVVAAGVAMVRSGLQVIDAQAKMAASLGTTVESMQVLERAGDLAGVSMGQVEQATIQLTRRLSQAASGTGPAVAALDRLGLSVQELGAMPLDQRIAAIQDSIEALIPATERAAVSSQLFGDRAGLVFSRIDTATLRQATKDVHDFGVVVSDQDAAQIERTNDAISRLGLIWRGLANQLAVAVAPALEAVADALAAVAARTGPLGRAIEVLFDSIGRLTAYAVSFAAFMAGRWVVALARAALGVKSLTAALTVLKGAIMRTGIGLLIVGAGELIYQFTKLVKSVGSIGEAFKLLWGVAREAGQRIVKAFEAAFALLGAGWQGWRVVVFTVLDLALGAVVKTADRIVASFTGAFDAIKAIWGALPGAIGDFAFQAANGLISGVEKMLNGVVSRINRFIEGMNWALSGLPDWAVGEGGIRIGLLDDVEITRITNPFEGQAAAAGAAAADAFADAFAETYFETPAIFSDAADEAKAAGAGYLEAAQMLGRAAIAPMESWKALTDAVAAAAEDGTDALDDAADAASRVSDALEDAGGAGGRAGKKIKDAAEEALKGWDAVAKSLSDYAEKASDIGGDIGNALVSAFQSAENAIGDFVKTGKLKFSDLVTSLLADLAKLGARRFLLGPLASALGGALGGIGASVFHAGGMVGGAAPSRMVPAMAFANAPRMHSGGWAGLRSDEVPAILQRGERVLSRREVAAGGGGVTVNINARDAESFRQSRAQIAADIARAVSFGRRGM